MASTPVDSFAPPYRAAQVPPLKINKRLPTPPTSPQKGEESGSASLNEILRNLDREIQDLRHRSTQNSSIPPDSDYARARFAIEGFFFRWNEVTKASKPVTPRRPLTSSDNHKQALSRSHDHKSSSTSSRGRFTPKKGIYESTMFCMLNALHAIELTFLSPGEDADIQLASTIYWYQSNLGKMCEILNRQIDEFPRKVEAAKIGLGGVRKNSESIGLHGVDDDMEDEFQWSEAFTKYTATNPSLICQLGWTERQYNCFRALKEYCRIIFRKIRRDGKIDESMVFIALGEIYDAMEDLTERCEAHWQGLGKAALSLGLVEREQFVRHESARSSPAHSVTAGYTTQPSTPPENFHIARRSSTSATTGAIHTRRESSIFGDYTTAPQSRRNSLLKSATIETYTQHDPSTSLTNLLESNRIVTSRNQVPVSHGIARSVTCPIDPGSVPPIPPRSPKRLTQARACVTPGLRRSSVSNAKREPRRLLSRKEASAPSELARCVESTLELPEELASQWEYGVEPDLSKVRAAIATYELGEKNSSAGASRHLGLGIHVPDAESPPKSHHLSEPVSKSVEKGPESPKFRCTIADTRDYGEEFYKKLHRTRALRQLEGDFVTTDEFLQNLGIPDTPLTPGTPNSRYSTVECYGFYDIFPLTDFEEECRKIQMEETRSKRGTDPPEDWSQDFIFGPDW